MENILPKEIVGSKPGFSITDWLEAIRQRPDKKIYCDRCGKVYIVTADYSRPHCVRCSEI